MVKRQSWIGSRELWVGGAARFVYGLFNGVV